MKTSRKISRMKKTENCKKKNINKREKKPDKLIFLFTSWRRMKKFEHLDVKKEKLIFISESHVWGFFGFPVSTCLLSTSFFGLGKTFTAEKFISIHFSLAQLVNSTSSLEKAFIENFCETISICLILFRIQNHVFKKKESSKTRAIA